MTKILVEAALAALVGLGLTLGGNPDVRGEVRKVWRETKAAIHETVEYAFHTAGDLISDAAVDVSAEAAVDASAQTDVSAAGQASNEAQVGLEAETQAEASTEADSESLFLNLGGNAGTGIVIGIDLDK